MNKKKDKMNLKKEDGLTHEIDIEIKIMDVEKRR